MDYKIAIIGNEDTVLGFKALGVEVFAISTQTEGEKALKQIREKNQYAIIFITENWTPKLEKELGKFAGQALPAIISIPSSQGTTGEGLKNISKIVEQAVGSDILSKQEN